MAGGCGYAVEGMVVKADVKSQRTLEIVMRKLQEANLQIREAEKLMTHCHLEGQDF